MVPTTVVGKGSRPATSTRPRIFFFEVDRKRYRAQYRTFFVGWHNVELLSRSFQHLGDVLRPPQYSEIATKAVVCYTFRLRCCFSLSVAYTRPGTLMPAVFR